MDVVTVNLPTQSFQLPKAALLEMFPDSILAQTARDYGDIFDITNPVVTPESLALIANILQTGELPATPPVNVYSMLGAFDFLNLPQLDLLADPFYSEFRQRRPEIDLLHIQPVLQNPVMYQNLLRDAIHGGGPVLSQYFIANAPETPEIQKVNASLFVYAASVGQDEIVAALLPKLSTKQVNDMLGSGELSPIYTRWLLSRPDANPTEDTIFDMMDILMRLKPDQMTNARLILTDPRINVNEILKAFFRGNDDYTYLPPDIVDAWIRNPKFDPTNFPKSWYISMVWLWPSEILSIYLDKFPQTLPEIKEAYEFGLTPNPLLEGIIQAVSIERKDPAAIAAIIAQHE